MKMLFRTLYLILGVSPQSSTEQSLDFMASRVQGSGGAIVINKHGDVGMAFTTERMAWAWVKQDTMHSGLNHGDDSVQTVQH